MASAANAANADVNGSPVLELCINQFQSQIIATNALPAACTGAGGLTLDITGPIGADGPVGATGPAGAQGAPGNTGLPGNHGAKGAQGPTGAQGPAGGVGGTGAPGPQGATGPVGSATTGPAGGTGGVGDQGVIGPQGPSGAVGATGPTAVLTPVQIENGCVGACAAGGAGLALPAGPGELGNTRNLLGQSRIVLTCPFGGSLLSGGANTIPADVPPSQNVRGILESSFPNPNDATQWIITAEVTQISSVPNAPPPAGPNLLVDPYTTCRF